MVVLVQEKQRGHTVPHKTPSGRTSKAWADKKLFPLAKRLTRSGDFGESKPDVEVPEIPEMQLDMKYRVGGWKHHTVFKTEIEDRYVKGTKDNFAVMHTKSGHERTSYVTVKLETWMDLLKRAYVDKKPRAKARKKGVWTCPRCGEMVGKQEQSVLQLYTYKCSACQLGFISEDNTNG
jgi:predicted RNA-binding Zn-ribbon protein involved in translation (DUF1610 family)